MAKVIGFFIAMFTCIGAWGQGTFLFDNRVPGIVDARVTMVGGIGFGEGWTAQFFGEPSVPGQPVGRTWTPLFPTTTFKTSSEAERGYVNPVVVTVPGVPSGGQVNLMLRVFNDAFPNCVAIGSSFTVTLGGGNQAPAYLVGMAPLNFLPGLSCIPEPSTILLGIMGVGLVFLSRRKQEGS
jgi:hypothetical protein